MIEIPDTVEKYRQKYSDYEELAERVDEILFEILDIEKVNYALIDSRPKTIESFQEKLKNSDGTNNELYDLAGIRVVGYVKSDVEKIVQVIRDNFFVDETKSKDKSLELKPDQFGYRAIHLVCTLPEERTILPEYKKFNGMYFEIQVKTILEHAWAQIEHDRNYKYKGLPKDIQHDFYLVAGNLESADKQFDSINRRIESYNNTISQKTEQGKLEEIEINPATLKRYLLDKFSDQFSFRPSYGDKTGENAREELSTMDIHNLKDLDELFPKEFVQIMKDRDEHEKDTANISSIIFVLLLLKSDKKRLFSIFSKTRRLNQISFDEFHKFYQKKIEKFK